MGAAVLVEIDLAWENLDPPSSPLERVLRVEGQVVRHVENGCAGFAVMATQTSIEPSSVVFEGVL